MLIEWSPKHIEAAELNDQLNRVKWSEDVLVIRAGARTLPKDRWIMVLKEHCNLIADRRHFDSHHEIQLADWWAVSYDPARASAYAHSKTPQPLHTDNAWFGDPAELNFFIMEKQAREGGEQTIYPLSRLIDDMASDAPGLLEDLSNVEVIIRKGDHDMYNRTTVIRRGARPQVFWNYYRTERTTPAIERMCDAFFAYLGRRTESSSVMRMRCDSGDCFSFNDLHMLHGRTAFEADKAGDRVLLHSMWKIRS